MAKLSKIEKQQQFVFLKLKDSRFSAFSYWDEIPGSLVSQLLSESTKYDDFVSFKRMKDSDWGSLLVSRIDMLPKLNRKLTTGRWDNIITSNPKDTIRILSTQQLEVSSLSRSTITQVCIYNPEVYKLIKPKVDEYLINQNFIKNIDLHKKETHVFLNDLVLGWADILKIRDQRNNNPFFDDKTKGLSSMFVYLSPGHTSGCLTPSGKIINEIRKSTFKRLFPIVSPSIIGDTWVQIIKADHKLIKHVRDWNDLSKYGLRSICEFLDKDQLRKIFKTLTPDKKEAFVVKKPHMFLNGKNDFSKFGGYGDDVISNILHTIRSLDKKDRTLAQRKIRKSLAVLPDRLLGRKIRRLSEFLEFEDSDNIEAVLKCIPQNGVRFLSDYDLNHVYRVCPRLITIKLNMSYFT